MEGNITRYIHLDSAVKVLSISHYYIIKDMYHYQTLVLPNGNCLLSMTGSWLWGTSKIDTLNSK
jgi:hypothetical protein